MSFKSLIKNSDADFKRNVGFFFLAYFCVLFNYPLIRASSTSLFFEAFGAKSSPAAWAWAVIFLTVSVFICNQIQKTRSMQFVFCLASLFSSFVFLSGSMSVFQENKIFAYLCFVWKEICVVIQVHLLLAYANNYFKKSDFKLLVGPVGAIGSLGGIFGGLLTSFLSSRWGTLAVLDVGVIFVLLPIVFVLSTKKLKTQDSLHESPISTLNTSDIKKYVFYICLLVTLAQFVINIADFKFNLALEKNIPTADKRTHFLGMAYTWTNSLTFIFQFLVLPLLLPRIKLRTMHLFIPLSYGVGLAFLVLGSQAGLASASIFYIYLKAADYSFFSAAKEILYQSLTGAQKYGAKYLTDMIVYRSSKALIAVVLIYLQSSFILDIMMLGLLLLWPFAVMKLFALQKKMFN